MGKAAPSAGKAAPNSALNLRRVGAWRGLRALAWDGDSLYGSRGYEVVRLRAVAHIDEGTAWDPVARFHPAWWRKLTSRTALTSRLVRDGFHALTILNTPSERTIVGTVPGAVV